MISFILRKVLTTETTLVFQLLKSAAKRLQQKGIQQWQYWHNPPQHKIDWVNEGIAKGEFYIAENDTEQVMAMVRILTADELYWGKQQEEALYIHSLVIAPNFEGKQLGKHIIAAVMQQAKANNIPFLRLDCDASNPKLCAYYTQQGFEQVGTQKLELGAYNLYQKRVH